MDNRLKELYEEIYGPSVSSAKNKMSNLTELGELLARNIDRKTPWTAHHLNAIIMNYKNFIITPELEIAIQAQFDKLDGTYHPLKARLIEITAYSVNGSVAPGSVVTGQSRRCDCGLLFVPHHPRQKYCCAECPGRPKRQGRQAKAVK